MNQPELTPKQKLSKYLKKVFRSYRGIPDKKVYVEFITALLSIPVLLTVMILNFNNLKGNKVTPQSTTQPEKQIIYISPSTDTTKISLAPTKSQEACKKSIAPISITSPDEGEVVTNNPVFVTISYEQGDFCSAVWAYRINGGGWSNYDDKSIALYNLPPGKIQLDLKVKSIVSSEERTLSRSFVYQGAMQATLTPTASTSAQ